MPVQFPHSVTHSSSSFEAFDSSVQERVLEPTGIARYESNRGVSNESLSCAADLEI